MNGEITTRVGNQPEQRFQGSEGSNLASTLAYGRHAGKPMADVQTNDLQWLAVFEVEGAELRSAINAELQRRGQP